MVNSAFDGSRQLRAMHPSREDATLRDNKDD